MLIYLIKVVFTSLFLSRLVCYSLNLADKHGITLFLTYIPIHLIVEADYISWRHLLPD